MGRKGKRKVAFFIIFFVILLVISLLVAYSNILNNLLNKIAILNIKTVNVTLNKVDCATPDQIKNTANLSGQNIFFIDSSKIESRIKNKFLCVKSAKLALYFPSKVNLVISAREPKASILLIDRNEATDSAQLEQVATPSASFSDIRSSFLVDDTGLIFAKDKNAEAPKIFYQDNDLVLGKTSRTIGNAIKILDKIKADGLNFSESEIMNGFFLIFPKDSSPRIVFRLEDDLDLKLASLQLILGQAKMNEKELEFIDLRFDNPIVKIAPKRKNG